MKLSVKIHFKIAKWKCACEIIIDQLWTHITTWHNWNREIENLTPKRNVRNHQNMSCFIEHNANAIHRERNQSKRFGKLNNFARRAQWKCEWNQNKYSSENLNTNNSIFSIWRKITYSSRCVHNKHSLEQIWKWKHN